MSISYKGQDTEKAGQTVDTLYQTASLVSSSLIFTTLGGATSSISLSSLSGSFSGSIVGTSSYALTSSHSTTLGASLANNSSGQLTLRNSNTSTISTISKLTASLALTASQADSSSYSLTSSYAHTASFAVNGLPAGAAGQILQIDPSEEYQLQTVLNDAAGALSVDFDNRALYWGDGATPVLNYRTQGKIYDNTGIQAISFLDDQSRFMYDEYGTASIDYTGRRLLSSDGLTPTLTYATNLVTVSGSLIVSGSTTIGSVTGGASENTLTLGPPPAGGAGEGGQLGLQATGGSYTSASFIDVYQDQFRILKGTNAVSSNGLLAINLQTLNAQFFGAVTASAYNGLPNDYLYVTRNTNQTIGSGTWADRDIVYNNSVVSKGISYNTGTGLATLTGGKVYRITARLAWSAAASYLLQFSCYNSSNSQLGPTVEIVQSTNGSNNISDGTLDFIYAPGSNVDIKIRTTNSTSALSGEFVRGDLNTQLIIQQIA